ncbi:hypothetical protein Dimus_024876, partial [Dionaea muscipula]
TGRHSGCQRPHRCWAAGAIEAQGRKTIDERRCSHARPRTTTPEATSTVQGSDCRWLLHWASPMRTTMITTFGSCIGRGYNVVTDMVAAA